jgi:hypothetical protein
MYFVDGSSEKYILAETTTVHHITPFWWQICPKQTFFTAATAIALLSKILEFRTCTLGGW